MKRNQNLKSKQEIEIFRFMARLQDATSSLLSTYHFVFTALIYFGIYFQYTGGLLMWPKGAKNPMIYLAVLCMTQQL